MPPSLSPFSFFPSFPLYFPPSLLCTGAEEPEMKFLAESPRGSPNASISA